MNDIAAFYIAGEQAAEAVGLLRQTLVLRERRAKTEPGDNVNQTSLAWTHGQMGEAEQARHDFAAVAQAYARSVELFEKLDQAGALKDPVFRRKLNFHRQRLALCRKAEQSVQDLEFALKQPAAEVPGLLDARLRVLAKKGDLPGCVATAEAFAKRAETADALYNACCCWCVCAKIAGEPGALATGGTSKPPVASPKPPVAGAPGYGECADKAMALLKQAIAKGYKNAAHMKQDKDLDALRDREDFKKLLAELEGKAKKKPITPEKK